MIVKEPLKKKKEKTKQNKTKLTDQTLDCSSFPWFAFFSSLDATKASHLLCFYFVHWKQHLS